MSEMQSRIIVVPSLEDLIDEFEEVLRSPSRYSIVDTDAKIAVLGNVRAAFVNQDQIPIPDDTSAARGSFVVLEHVAQKLALIDRALHGDLQPPDADRLSAEQDLNGRLNPMRLFEEHPDLDFGLYPFLAVAPALLPLLDEATQRYVSSRPDAIVFVHVTEQIDWETWMETFAR